MANSYSVFKSKLGYQNLYETPLKPQRLDYTGWDKSRFTVVGMENNNK